MERDELDTVLFDDRVGFVLHRPQDLFERDERFRLGVVDVGLVDLVGHEDEPLVVTHPHDLPHVALLETPTRRVSRVDDDERLDGRLGAVDRVDGGLKHGLGQGPPGGFLQLVRNRMARQGGERGRVKRVLGDGDEYAVSRAETDVEELTDPGRGSGGEEDVFGVARESITTCRRAVHGVCVSVPAYVWRLAATPEADDSRSMNWATLSLISLIPLLCV